MAKSPNDQEPANMAALVKAVRSLAQAQSQSGRIEDERHRENLIWTKRAFKANAIYVTLTLGIAMVSVYSAWEARRQADAAERAMELTKALYRDEHAPFMSLSQDLGSPEFRPNDAVPGYGQILWTYHFENTGKSPAQNFIRKQYIKLGDQKFQESFGQPDNQPRVTVAPNRDLFNTVISSRISMDEFKKLMAVDQGVKIAITFEYSDETGKSYSQNICLARLANGAILICDDRTG